MKWQIIRLLPTGKKQKVLPPVVLLVNFFFFVHPLLAMWRLLREKRVK